MNTQATTPTVTPFTQNLKQQQQRQTAKEIIAENVKILIEQLEAGHSDALTAYLDAMSRFRSYSFGNVLEIARQRPSATKVAGMYAWNQLGRRVKKGEKGNLYLSLADAPFDREDCTLNPTAGACINCPRRSGHNTSLFCDVQGDQCLDSNCYKVKVEVFLDREIAAHPGLVQIENGWRNPKEQRPGAVQRGHIRELPTVTDNPDAEPQMPCSAAKTAIVVYGKQLGRKLTVCTDKHCPVHDPQAAAEAAAHPAPTMAPASEAETEEEAAERKAEFERLRVEYEEEQQKREEERKQQFEQEQANYEAERNRKAEILQAREKTLNRILENAPQTFTAAQLRVFLSALCNLDPYTITDDVAEHFAGEDNDHQRTPEEILAAAISKTPDEKLTSFALRLALTGYVTIPRENELDFLAEAEALFVPPPPVKEKKPKKSPIPIKATPKKAATKKRVAA